MLPNAATAVVEPSKVRDYLLSATHPIGRFKAVVFTALGYSQEDWPRLREDLLLHGRSGQARLAEATQYGQKYLVSGTLTGPNGRTGALASVWLVESEASAPRFLTAYPE
jgi:Domain of unknown function (DUF4926)